MKTVVYRNGSLWASHTVFLPAGASPTRSAAQWWQINPDASIVQFGRVDDASGATFYAFPSLAVNVNNDVLIGYSRFSATQYASANYSFRAGTDPSGTLQGDSVFKAGLAKYYKTYNGATNRWGDYSSAVVDPTDDFTMWVLQEYASAPFVGLDHWGTWWAAVRGR